MVLPSSPTHIDSPVDLQDTKGDSPVSEEEQKEVKAVLKLFNKWKSSRSAYDRKWMDYYKLFRGVQWSTRRPAFRHSEIINMVFSTIQSNMPLQLDARPRFQFLPQEPSDRDFAEILNQLSEFDWEKHNWMRTLSEVVLDGYLYGTGFSSMEYDPDLDFGIGAAVYQSEDPFYCYPDPESNDINDPKSQGFFHAQPIETARLKAMFPDKADSIKPDVNDFIKSSKSDINSFYRETFSTDLEMPEFSYDHKGEEQTGIERTFLIKGYLKPFDVKQVEKEIESEDGETKIEIEIHKKFPKGRMVWIANGRFLKDEEFEYEDGKIPYQKYNNYILSREFWGISEVEQLESPQKVFNKILSFTLDAMTLMGNPVWIVDTGAGVATENLTGEPGLVVEKEPGTEVRREQGPSINPSFLNVLNQLEVWFNNVSGTQDVSTGQTPGSVTAASAIEQLQNAARTRIRQKMRNLDGYLRDVGDQWQARVFQFYSIPKVIRITGKDDVAKFFKFSIEKDQETGQRIASVQEFLEPNEEGKGDLVPGSVKKLIVKGFFDTKTMTGSSLPFAIADRENKALALFDRGILDAEEVLNIVDFPNKEKILLRLKEREQAAAEAQAGGGPPQQ